MPRPGPSPPASAKALARAKASVLGPALRPISSRGSVRPHLAQVSSTSWTKVHEEEWPEDLVVLNGPNAQELGACKSRHDSSIGASSPDDDSRGSRRNTRVPPPLEDPQDPQGRHEDCPPLLQDSHGSHEPRFEDITAATAEGSALVRFSILSESAPCRRRKHSLVQQELNSSQAPAGSHTSHSISRHELHVGEQIPKCLPSSLAPSAALSEALNALEAAVSSCSTSLSTTASPSHTVQLVPASHRRHSPSTCTTSLLSQVSKAPNLQTLHELHSRSKHLTRGPTVAMLHRYAMLVDASGRPTLQQLPLPARQLWDQLCEQLATVCPSLTPRQVSDVLQAVQIVYQPEHEGDSHMPKGAVPPCMEASHTSKRAAPSPNEAPHILNRSSESGSYEALHSSTGGLHESNNTSNASKGESGVIESQQHQQSMPGPDTLPPHQNESPQASSPATAAWEGSPMKGRSKKSQKVPLSLRPFTTRLRLPPQVEDLIRLMQQHGAATLHDPSLGPLDFARLAACMGRLGPSFRPNALWYTSFYAASEPHLAQFGKAELLTMSYGLGRMCPRSMPTTWAAQFFHLTQQQLRNLDEQEMCMLVHAVAHLPLRPPPLWLQESLHRSTEMLDNFDAPAYAKMLHALGMMSFLPPRPWVEEFMDSCATLLHDFRPEELSLLLRGCAQLNLTPSVRWMDELYMESAERMRSAGGPQLVDIAWALASLGLQPPRYWVHAYTSALQLKVSSVRNNKAHAQKTAAALRHFRVRDLSGWCQKLGVDARVSDGIGVESDHEGQESDRDVGCSSNS